MTEEPAIIVERLRQAVLSRRYRLTLHAELERDADQITIEKIEQALLSEQCRVLEDYPTDPRGASCLVLGFTSRGSPIHILCGVSVPDMLVIITVYRPDPGQWINWRIRREV